MRLGARLGRVPRGTTERDGIGQLRAGLARLPLSMLSGRDPEADVMGTRAIAAADPDRFEPSSEQAHAAADARPTSRAGAR